MDNKTERKNKRKKIVMNAWTYVKRHTILLGFYLLAFVFFINGVIMTLHYINRDYDYQLLNRLYVSAVLPNQDVTGTMQTGIVKIKEIDLEKLTNEDQVIVCCDFGIDEYWVEDVVNIDQDNKLIDTTYDGTLLLEVEESEVLGVYVKDANFFGTIYYTSTFLYGYIMLLATEVMILGVYYVVAVRKIVHELWENRRELIGDRSEKNAEKD